MTGTWRDLDRDALVQAVAAGVLIVGPLAGLSIWLVDPDAEDPSGLGPVLFLAVVVGFGVVGWIAGRAAPRVPMTHGAAAGAAAFVVVQATILLIAWVAGHDVDPSPFALVVNAFLAATAGTIGAMLAARRPRRA